MKTKTWRGWLRRLILADPADRWDADPFIIGPGVFAAAWVANGRENILAGIGVAALVIVVRETLFHIFVRRRRARASPMDGTDS